VSMSLLDLILSIQFLQPRPFFDHTRPSPQSNRSSILMGFQILFLFRHYMYHWKFCLRISFS